MRREQQFGLIVLAIAVTGMLVVGAGGVFAQEGNGTAAGNNTSEFNCEETTEVVMVVSEEGNITETFPVGYVNYQDRVERVTRQIQDEYLDEPGVKSVGATSDPNKQVCGQPVLQVSVALNFSQFDGEIPTQRNGVNITTREAPESVGLAGGGGAGGGSSAGSGGPVGTSTEDTTTDSGEGKAKSGDTTTQPEDGGGKAKQPADGDDGAADGGTGKAKAGDGGDGDDAADGGNGKSKAN